MKGPCDTDCQNLKVEIWKSVATVQLPIQNKNIKIIKSCMQKFNFDSTTTLNKFINFKHKTLKIFKEDLLLGIKLSCIHVINFLNVENI